MQLQIQFEKCSNSQSAKKIHILSISNIEITN